MISKLYFVALCPFLFHVILVEPNIDERKSGNEKYNASNAVTKMISKIQLNTTVGWKQFSYLTKYPQNFDVTFAVGPKKQIVKALKIALTSSSPVFEREFDLRCEKAVLKKDNIVLLPDLDPSAFKLFVELMILDTWSLDALKALELPSIQMLHLMSICHKYGMKTAMNNLANLAKGFSRDFGALLRPEDFLLLSQAQLESVLASDELPIKETDVYNYAQSWATEQCKQRNLEATGENIRLVLGNCVYQIRFPTMSFTEFANVTQLEGLLSLEETVQIFQFIAMGKSSMPNDKTELKFKTERRIKHPITLVPEGSSKVSLTQVFNVTKNSAVCDGKLIQNRFNMNTKIALRGFGFLGPIDSDSFYNVTVRIWKNPEGWITSQMATRIFAEKSKTFYFIFDQPIILDPISHDNWSKFYVFVFELKGPKTRSLEYGHEVTKRIYDDDNEFVIYWRSPHLVEILYNNFN